MVPPLATRRFRLSQSVGRVLQGDWQVSPAQARFCESRQLTFPPHFPTLFDEIREKKGLRKLRTYIIDVISGDTGPDGSQAEDGGKPLLMESSASAEQLKELKLGSTYIRQWLSKNKKNNGMPESCEYMVIHLRSAANDVDGQLLSCSADNSSAGSGQEGSPLDKSHKKTEDVFIRECS